MRTSLFTLLILFSITVFAQKRKKKEQNPKSTPADVRWQGYEKRRQLEEKSWVKEIPFKNLGPTVMSGRVVDLAVDPKDPTHFYVAYASGSLWETTNNGTSFLPIFDNQIVMTIGDIAVDWKNNVIYVGSGENNSSRSSYAGYGIFKSADNGANWEHLGLAETHHIGRILLDPNNEKTIWAASLGHLYSPNKERGIYKSNDGGQTWKQTLYINEQTGIIDLAMSPSNPDILLAAAWEKDRKAWNFQEAGEGSGIYRSEDGGDSWSLISDDSGMPNTTGTGRIGLAFAPSDGNIVYAILDNQDRRPKEEKEVEEQLTKDQLRTLSVDDFLGLENRQINDFLDENGFPSKYNAVDIKKEVEKGKVSPTDLVTYTEDANSLLFDTPVKGGEMYKSLDAGKTWLKTHEGFIESMIYSYGYYFGQVRVDAKNPEVIYTMGVPIVISKDGGKTFKSINEENVHVDHHALWVNPSNSDHLILGNDGGVYISYDQGTTWTNCNSPSVGQFYAIAVDLDKPYNVYGGLQDNGVWKGPSTYEYDRRWYQEGKYPYERLIGGDGMQVAVDTRDNETVYTGYQFGNYFRINTSTGERAYITPRHELGDAPYRWNWEAPIVLSSHNQDIVYFGSNRFHRSMNKGADFETLSKDLTKGGKKGDVSYGTLTSITESPLQFGLLYVGSDDGLVHFSSDAGETWENISKGLPENYWVSTVQASSHKKGRVYVSLNGYRWDNFEALVYKSEDFGKTWEAIKGNLPAEPVNVIKEDPVNEQLIYVGTDHGVYASIDMGKTYHAFVEGLPNTPVHDLVVHPRDGELVLGTHGRGIYKADVRQLQKLTDDLRTKSLHLFEIPAITYSNRWNAVPRAWSEKTLPTTTIEFFAKNDGEALLEISYKGSVVISKKVPVFGGINNEEINLEVQENFKDLLPEDEAELYESSFDGKYFLSAGKYEVRLSMAGTEATTEWEIKTPKSRNRRAE